MACSEKSPEIIKNPYGNINWGEVNQYKMNLHSHTIKSDGRAEPDELIYMYADADYQILAITDHDNYYVNRDGERDVDETHETTWPWTRWIDEILEQIWEHDGMESSAYYPDLGKEGMLAIRGAELTQHPHMLNIFTDCGFRTTNFTDEERINCIESKNGLSFWLHPTDYIPGGRWEDLLFEMDFENALDHYAEIIIEYDAMLGIETQLEDRLERDLKLLDTLLNRYYREHDIYIKGSDDKHGTSISNDVMTLVFAEDLTENSIRTALKNGNTIVGVTSDAIPEFQSILIDEKKHQILLNISDYDEINWYRNGEYASSGENFDYYNAHDSIIRFEAISGNKTFYSQPFYFD